nr:hypothetical protein [Tanacetum cinerariifolium]
MSASSECKFVIPRSFVDEEVDDVLENGPRMIRTIPIILKKWTTFTSLRKEVLTRVLFWVKLRGVPMKAFTVDGLSAIATKIGKSFMIDSITSMMCNEPW